MNWKKSDFDDDLKHALKEDRTRGTTKNVPKQEAIKERRGLIQDMKSLLKERSKKKFIAIITGTYGLQEGSDPYNQALQAWTEYHTPQKKLKKP